MQESKYTKVCQIRVIISTAQFILKYGALAKSAVYVGQKQFVNS